MAEYRLRDMSVGDMARVIAIRPTHRSYRSKLLSMGLTRGTIVRVQRVAPLGDPVVISVRGFNLSLRKDEADALVLEPVAGDPDEYGFFGGPGRGRSRGRGRRAAGRRRGRFMRGPRPRGTGNGRGSGRLMGGRRG